MKVELDGKRVFELPDSVAKKYGINSHEEISRELVNRIIEEYFFLLIIGKVVKFLSYRSRTKIEIENRIDKYAFQSKISSEFSKKLKTEILRYLVDAELYNEDRNTHEIVKAIINSRKDYSKREIIHRAAKLGVPKKVVTEAFYVYNVREYDRIERLLDKRLGGLTGKLDFDTMAKQKSYLLRRGFNYELVNKALNQRNNEK